MNPTVGALVLLGQAENAGQTAPLWVQILVSILPWVLVFVVVWYLVWKFLTRYQRPLQDRSLEYMDRLEANTGEMVELLKQINDKLGRPGS
ncbi:MAG TPA: hypothetical protein VM243_12525 [Phycisphaerae bacterium]|nr:hypothetical protein [Phycisphaerae bacterium]